MSAQDAMALRWKNERQFTDWCIGVFRQGGWLITHMRDSRKQHPNTHTGTPDLKATHPVAGYLLEAELKMEGKNPEPDQEEWLAALRNAQAFNPLLLVFVWRPRDWREVRAVSELRIAS